MSNNKEVKVTIDVGAKFTGKASMDELKHSVQALANATGLTGKQINKAYNGFIQFEDAHRILAHLNNTIGLSSTQIKLFAQEVGKSYAEVQDFLEKNKDLTTEYAEQCKIDEELRSAQSKLSAERKEQEKSLNSLRKEYKKLGGDVEQVSEKTAKYMQILKDMQVYQGSIKSKIEEKNSLEAKLKDIQNNKVSEDINKKIESRKITLNTLTADIEALKNGGKTSKLVSVQNDIVFNKEVLKEKNELLKNVNKDDTNSINKLKESIETLENKLKELEQAEKCLKEKNPADYINLLTKAIEQTNSEIGILEAKVKGSFTEEESKKLKTLEEEINSITNSYNIYNSMLPKNYDKLIETGKAIEKLSEEHRKNEEQTKKLDEQLQVSTSIINEQSKAVTAAASIQTTYINKQLDSIKANTELKESTEDIKNSTEKLKSSTDDAKSSIEELKSTEKGLSKSTSEIKYELALLGQSANYVGKQIYSMSSMFDCLTTSINNTNSALFFLYPKCNSFLVKSYGIISRVRSNASSLNKLVDESANGSSNAFSNKSTKANGLNSKMPGSIIDLSKDEYRIIDSTNETSNTLSRLDDKINKVSGSAQWLGRSFWDLEGSFREINSRFEFNGLNNKTNEFDKLDQCIKNLEKDLNKLDFDEIDETFGSGGIHIKDHVDELDEFDKLIEDLDEDFDDLDFEEIDENFGKTGIKDVVKGAFGRITGAAGELKDITGNLGKLDTSLDKTTIKQKLLNMTIELGKKIYKEYVNTLESVGKVAINAGKSLVNGFGQAIEVAEKLINTVSEACNKIKELADAGSELQAGWFKLYNYLGEEGGNTYTEYLNELHDVLSVDADDIVQNAEGVLSMVDNLGLSLEKSTEAMEAFTNFGLDLSTFSGEEFSAIIGQLENAVNLNVLNSRSALAHALNLTNKDIEVFKSFNSEQERANYLLSRGGEFRDNYKKWLQTAGGRVAQLNNSVSSLTENVQKLSTGLLAKLAPAITSIIKLLDRLVSMLYKVFNIKDLTSAEGNMAKGFDGVVGDAESATEALDDTTEAAKKLERQVAGFDDVIQINDSSSSSKDIKDKVNGLMGDIDFSDWLEDLTPNPSAFEKKLDKIYDMIGKGKWAEVGNKVRDLIVNGLNSIDWDEIKSKLTGFTRGLSNLLNGLLENGKLAGSIGTSLSELINTVVAGINAFLGNEELFKNLGISLSKGLNSFFETLDAEGIANMLSSFVHDVFTTFSNFVDTMNKDGTWSLIGTKISAIINGFFSSFTIEDVQNGVDSIISFINGVFEMIGTFMDNLDTEDIKNKITTFVRGLFEGFKEHQDEWAATLSEFTGFIMDLLSSLIRTWDKTGMTNAVIEFIADSGIGDLVWKLTKTKFKIGWEKFKIEFISALEAFFGDILYKIGNIIGLIIATVIEFLDTIGADIMYALGNIIGYITVAISGLIGAILGLGTRLKEGLGEVWDWVKDLFSNIFDWVGDWVSKLWDKVSGFFESLKDKILGVDETVSSAESHSSGGGSHSGGGYYRNGNGFISSYSDEGIEVPLLANGGIVHRATLATIGEAGTEAVVPLQNNTEWMDTMAKSLVSAMDNKNNGMTGSTVVIDMSKCSKQVYTRSELQAFGKLIADSLNTYGANVAYNY